MSADDTPTGCQAYDILDGTARLDTTHFTFFQGTATYPLVDKSGSGNEAHTSIPSFVRFLQSPRIGKWEPERAQGSLTNHLVRSGM